MSQVALALAVLALVPAGSTAAERPLAFRGVIEGFYGAPWTSRERMDVLRLAAARGMNTYVRAPKDDPFQRARWRDPYPPPAMARFRREIRWARARGIAWVPNVSPARPVVPTGLPPGTRLSAPLCFGCARDRAVLVGKLRPFVRAGSAAVMVSFDDTAEELTDGRDRARYGAGKEGVGRATRDVLEHVRRRLGPRVRVLTVLSDYFGTDPSPYLRAAARGLDRRIEVMWTGLRVFSTDFSPRQARAWARATGRPPLLWDNWTVNDVEGGRTGRATRIHLGPYRRRADAARELRGVLLNPSAEAALDLLPFATAADWMRAPSAHRPERSWRRAVRALGGDRSEALRAFAEVNRSNPLAPGDEAPTFRRLAAAFLRGEPGARRALDAELRRVAGARAVLERGSPALRRFAADAAPFLRAAEVAARAGLTGSALLAAVRAAAPPVRIVALRAQLARRRAAFASSPRLTYGYRRIRVDLPAQPVPPNRMEAFLDAVAERTGPASP